MTDQLGFIVRVVRLSGAEPAEFLGTGIVVAANKILTCRHVVEEKDFAGRAIGELIDSRHLEIQPRTAPGAGIRDIAIDPKRDLALLTLDQHLPQTPPPFLAELEPALETALAQSRLQAMGYPGTERGTALWRHSVTPLLQSFSAETNRLVSMQLAGGLPAGFSGSPVLLDHQGQLVCAGITYLGSEHAATSRLIAADAVLEFLDQQGITSLVRIAAAPVLAPSAPAATEQPLRRWQRWLVTGLAILLGCWLALSAPGQVLDSIVADQLFEWRGPMPPPAEVVIVRIDDPSLAELNLLWPWPRTLHAKLLDALFQAGAKVVVFDLIFAEPSADPADDQAFAAALQRHPDVILAAHLDEESNKFGDRTSWTLPRDDFITSQERIGFANLTQRGGVVRSVTITAEQRTALAYSALRAFVGHFPDQYAGSDLDTLPAQMFINFSGPAGTLKSVSYYQALQPQEFLPADYFKNKLVFVGAATNIGGGDSFPVPGSDSVMYGVEIHANAAYNLLQRNYLQHPGKITLLLTGLLSGLLSALCLFMLRPGLAIALLAGVGVLLLIAVILLFSFQSYILPLSFFLLPMGGVLLARAVLRRWQLQRNTRMLHSAAT